MRTVYNFNATGKCPVNGATDEYSVEVVVEGFYPVEEILKKSAAILAKPIFQEAYTQLLAMELQSTVVTVGDHSGVQTRCTVLKPEGDDE